MSRYRRSLMHINQSKKRKLFTLMRYFDAQNVTYYFKRNFLFFMNLLTEYKLYPFFSDIKKASWKLAF